MRDEELLAEAQAWKQRATAVLDASQLLDVLPPPRRVVFSGSYAYDLMMSPDIDVHVLPVAFGRRAAIDGLCALVEHGWWNTYTLGDYVEERFRADLEGQVTRGYLLKLGRTFEDRRWNVDMWLLDPARYPGDLIASKMAAVTPEQRLAILRIKEARAEGKLSASGVEIYSAVLDHDLATPGEFVSWQRNCGPSTEA